MELIIKLDDDIAKGIRGENDCKVEPREIVRSFQATIADAIKNGTPLPKGHGRLKDIDTVERLLDLDKPDNVIAKALKGIIESVPTLVEADKSEGKNEY